MGVRVFSFQQTNFMDSKPFKVSLWLFHDFYFQLALRTVNSSVNLWPWVFHVFYFQLALCTANSSRSAYVCFMCSTFSFSKLLKVGLQLFHVFYFQLALWTVNSSRSSYGCFIFSTFS